jgi:nitroreductase
MTLDEAIVKRRSVRAFLPREVPPETIREVFELAQRAPSNCNSHGSRTSCQARA